MVCFFGNAEHLEQCFFVKTRPHTHGTELNRNHFVFSEMAVKNITQTSNFPFSRDLLCHHGSFSGKIYPPFRASKATIQVALFDVPLPLRYLDSRLGGRIEKGIFGIGE